jgi:hypothetical protein
MGVEKFSDHLPSEESTTALVARLRSGDQRAFEPLTRVICKPFQRWLKCRTPAWSLSSTRIEDLVERTLQQSLDEAELNTSERIQISLSSRS